MAMNYAIPPVGYTQAEAFRDELQRVQTMLGNNIVGFESPEEVAAWLQRIGFRRKQPIAPQQIRRWCVSRHFPFTRPRNMSVKWFTTSAHVLAWLWTYATYPPKRVSVGTP